MAGSGCTVLFKKLEKFKKPHPNTSFPLESKLTKFSKALKQNQLGFYCSAKMEHLGKTFTHTHPFLVSPSLLQLSAEEHSALQFKTASGELALVKILLHTRGAVELHPPSGMSSSPGQGAAEAAWRHNLWGLQQPPTAHSDPTCRVGASPSFHPLKYHVGTPQCM